MQSKGFNNLSEKQKPSVLYHCLLGTPKGDELQTSCNREVNGKQADYLFASPYLSKALAFGFDYHNEEILMNGSLAEHNVEYAIICDRDQTMSSARQITVYCFSDEGFSALAGARQSVSESAVPFSKTKVVLTGQSAEDLLKAGLQVLSFSEKMEDILDEMLNEKTGVFNQLDFMKQIGGLVKSGRLHWENKERNLCPNKHFGTVLGVWSPAPVSQFKK